ncbi:unnamed protein product [Effrenium voratum]|nr:unnamed protein product [Effrenium voratum]CAJ1413883.1 unnamed protein product [Effrenium voratum]
MAGTKKKAVVTPKRPKKKREKKRDTESPSEERRIVTVGFDDNQYTGYLHTNSLAQRYLEGADSKYTWQSGAKYEGPFLHSEIQGQGKYTWPDGSTYQGDLHNGKRHGFGVFVAADGVTKYEGQWSEGKRHGAGRLVYDADGNSFYQGQWFEGCKHGKGRQVWPSKNTYEGEWQEGRMHGFGTMTWCENAQIEVYTGEWAQNLPQGQGKYIWHAPDCVQGKEMPVQQTNNSFKGSWSQGLRSGYGKFQFANGAKYEGQWTDNIKHGEGRYTFEDGRVYVGEFVSDNMATPSSPEAEATSQALNLGGADNPVRRCVDVGDLAGFCLPKDRPVTDPTELTGYSEPADVFREIYNVLLRHLGDLKKVYARVRRVVQSDGDPWLVYTYQWWILLREVNLLAPDCFLARADRRVRCGPRQHGEAFYEDMPELRPLTPRPVHAPPSHGERGSLSRKASRDGDQGLTHEQEPLLEEDEDEDVGDDEDEELEEEEGEAETEAVEADAAAEDEAEADKKSCTSRHSRNSRQSRMSFARGRDAQGSRRPTLQSLGRQTSSIGPIDFFFEQNKFWRLEDSEAAAKLVDVHSPRASLMFRHFLEALVRIAPVAYPEHQGLESMLKALLRERILPQAPDKCLSQPWK